MRSLSSAISLSVSFASDMRNTAATACCADPSKNVRITCFIASSAARSASLELSEFGPCEPQIQAGLGAADLIGSTGITGVIAYDDMIAIGVITRLAERGLRAGVDVSVIGVDDSPLSAMSHPTLTSVHVPGDQAGSLAVDLLLEVLERPRSTETIQLDTTLVVRGSTGPAPVPKERRNA